MVETVSEKDFKECLLKLRSLRLWAVQNRIDPWAFRQMLLIALEMDTQVALERGVNAVNIENFDSFVKKDIKSWIKDYLKLRG